MTAGTTTRRRPINVWEVACTAALFALGAFVTVEGFGFSLGTVTRMGPGFFPVAIGILIMGLATGIFLDVRHSQAPPPDLPFRPFLAITAGLLAFAALIERAGLIPATFVLVLVSSLGNRPFSPVRAVLTALGVCLLGYLVFLVGFRLPLDAFWW